MSRFWKNFNPLLPSCRSVTKSLLSSEILVFAGVHCIKIFTTSNCIYNYLKGNVQNKPNRRCYEDMFNQINILILVVYFNMIVSTINISANTTFEQIMVDSSIN